MSRVRRFIDRHYSPKPAKWKRPTLFALGLAMTVAAVIGGWAQMRHSWMPNGEWWLLVAAFGVLGVAGILVSLFGSDYWVAVTLGRPDF